MVPSVTGKKIAHSLPEAARRDPPLQRAKEKVVGSGEKSDGKGRGGSSNYPMWKSTTMVRKTQTSHMKVPRGYAVLDCGAAKNLSETCCSDGTDLCTRR